MDLWIRSQDKRKLDIAKDMHICERRVVVEYPELHSEKDPDNYVILIGGYEYGVYKTKERALEVLDEIQNKLIGASRILVQSKAEPKTNPNDNFYLLSTEPTCTAINQNVLVYEMPADDEVE